MSNDNKDNKDNLSRNFGPTNFAVNNRISMFLLTIIIMFAGGYAYIAMPKESFQRSSFRQFM